MISRTADPPINNFAKSYGRQTHKLPSLHSYVSKTKFVIVTSSCKYQTGNSKLTQLQVNNQ